MTARVFLLAAIMFVDDTDLLHWAPSPTTSDEALIELIQGASNDWAHIAQETGGAIKPVKSSLDLLTYKFF